MIPGLKRSRSPESIEDNDDSFLFLNTEGNDHSPSPQQETPGFISYSYTYNPVEEPKENNDEEKKDPTPIPTIVEPKPEPEEHHPRNEATPSASVPPDSIASFTYENTPEVDFAPVKRKRGRPAKIRPPVVYTEPGTPASTADPQNLVTPTALPQLMADGDENTPLEIDTAGETKVTLTGYLAGNREYALKTFTIIGHGEKLFMLATEVARLTGYRDSYLFFLRNRTLRKVVTTQTEKEDLISQEVIPFSYRSRQISVVTARSVFVQFGHRVIVGGQRIRDDYFEERARKDHHVEMHVNDTRELRHQAAVAAANAAAMNSSNIHNAHLPPPAPLAISSNNPHTDLLRPRDYPLPKAKPPIFGAPWHEHYQPLSASLMLEKAQAVMRFNSLIAEERKARANMWNDWWVPASARVDVEQHHEGNEQQVHQQQVWTGGYHV